MEALNKILIIKGILAEKAGLDPQLYSELEVQFDELKQLLNKCNVSGTLPVDSAIKEIENLMERWHLGRDNDDETLQGINDVLVNIGLLGWFNRQ